jgi:hypothetical protein
MRSQQLALVYLIDRGGRTYKLSIIDAFSAVTLSAQAALEPSLHYVPLAPQVAQVVPSTPLERSSNIGLHAALSG